MPCSGCRSFRCRFCSLEKRVLAFRAGASRRRRPREEFAAAADHISSSVRSAAREAGFSEKAAEHRQGTNRTLVVQDELGRAVVAAIVESDKGPRISLDLSGFRDGKCHAVMDRLLEGLARR